MAKVQRAGADFKITFSFWERLGGLSGDLVFPLDSITSLSEANILDWRSLGFRIGTGIPGFAVLGRFRKRGIRTYCNWTRGQQVLIIQLANQRYDRVLVGCEDPAALIELLK